MILGKLISIGGAEDKGTEAEPDFIQKNNLNFFELGILKRVVEEFITKISGGWMEFDKIIATMDMMPKLSKLSKILGPKGLMPNPKLGTVTQDVVKAIEEQKAGKVDFRTEKNGVVHILIGKKSFGLEKLLENFKVILQAILRAKPVTSKGIYLKGVSISSSMGPGIKLNPVEFI